MRFFLLFRLVFGAHCFQLDDDKDVKSQDHDQWDGKAKSEAVEYKCGLPIEHSAKEDCVIMTYPAPC